MNLDLVTLKAAKGNKVAGFVLSKDKVFLGGCFSLRRIGRFAVFIVKCRSLGFRRCGCLCMLGMCTKRAQNVAVVVLFSWAG